LPSQHWTALTPIPRACCKLDAGGYGEIEIDPQHELHHEPLVSLTQRGFAGANHYGRTDGGNAPYYRPVRGSLSGLWARKSVAEKLMRVNRGLQLWGFRVFIWDAYRPATCQQGLWEFWWEQARREDPAADEASIRSRVLQFVSDPTHFDPDDPTTIPTHATGAAIDLTLQHLASGALAEMGADFDEMTDRAASDYYERALQRGGISHNDPRLLHRRLLYTSMRAEAFVNYPPEFWHFDWGNQMYVRNLRSIGGDAPQAAWYGYVRPPEGDGGV